MKKHTSTAKEIDTLSKSDEEARENQSSRNESLHEPLA
jgi:hypothetical protein